MSNKDQADIGAPPADGDKNYGGILIGINWAVFAPATFFVALRVYTRLRISHNIGWDDAMIVLAQAINCVGMGFVMLECHFGLGRHKYFLDPNHYDSFLKYNFLDWNQVFITLCLSKIAICMFLLRLSKFAKWRNFLYGVIAFLVLSHLPLELLFLLQCIPLNKNWDQQVPGTCFSLVTVEKIIIVQGAFSILTDVVLAAFPLLLLWNMRLPKRQKILLNCLLGLGILTALVCIVRTIFSYEIKQPDVTWQGVPNALCRMLEINFGISAACMPMMRTLFISIKKQYFKHGTESLSSARTPASQLQWYTPPSRTPWYLRVKRSLWHPAPAMDIVQTGLPDASDSDRSLPKPDSKIEKISRPPSQQKRSTSRPPFIQKRSFPKPIPKMHPPWRVARDMSPRYQARPSNATWAKDDPLSHGDSFDLPIQGPRKKGWHDEDEDEKEDEEEAGFDTYRYHNNRYHNNWV